MNPQDEPLHDLLDRWVRETLLHPANLRSFLRAAVPDLADAFDCDHARLLDREFPMDDWRRRAADVPFEIPYRVGEEERTALVFVLIEHQSDTDTLIPLRTLYFVVLYWDRQWQAWTRLPTPRPPLRLNPVLPLVFYTNHIPWGSNRTLRDLLGEPESFHAFAPDWQPLFWNLSDRSTTELLGSDDEWLQTLAVLRAQAENSAAYLAAVTESAKRLESLHDRDHARWYNLMRLVVAWSERKRPPAELTALRAAVQSSVSETERRQEVNIMANTIAEMHIEQGEARANRKTLLRQLQARFGSLPEALVNEINAATDLPRLEAALDQVMKIQQLSDFHL